MESIVACITAIRNIRSVWQIDPGKRMEAKISVSSLSLEKLFKANSAYIQDPARIEYLEIGQKLKRPKASAVAVVGDTEIFVPLAGVIDVGKEANRLKQKIEELDTILKNSAKKLKNKQFLSRAPKQVVAAEKEKQKQFKESIKKLKDNLKGFK